MPGSAVCRPRAVPVTIAACAPVALFLRAYQLSRPGYLLGVTEYDDGVLFGDALRLVTGVIPCRDFAMVQPPGSTLIMAPVALLARVTGIARGLAIARILTVAAGIVRRRGALTAGVACGIYTVMFLWPRLYYSHYGAFDGPFLALAVALPAGLLTADTSAAGRAQGTAAVPAIFSAVLAAVLVTAGNLQFRAESLLYGIQVAAAADRLIPAGACVATNDSAYTVAAGRFYSAVPGCPAMTDSFGTLIAMTSGREHDATAALLRPVGALWQQTPDHAQYVWLTSDTVAQIPWTRQLYAYFRAHFRLIGLAGPPTPWRYVPQPGLYAHYG